MDMIRRTTADESRAARKPLEFVLSDETKDRLGDVILASGWVLDNFKRNPIAMFNHDRDFPIGTWSNVHIEGKKLVGDLKLAEPDTSGRIAEIVSLVKQGVLKAVSVGFKPIEREPLLDDEGNPTHGILFRKQELLETSLVSVPANPAALQVARSLHISDDTLRRVFGEQALVDATRALPTSTSAQLPTAGKPKQDAKDGRRPMSNFQHRIEAAQSRVNLCAQAVTDFLSSLPDDEPDDATTRKQAELNDALQRAKSNLVELERAERILGETTAMSSTTLPAVIPPAQPQPRYTGPSVRLPFAEPAQSFKPVDFLVRHLVGLIHANGHKTQPGMSHSHALALRYGDDYANNEKTRVISDSLIMRAATAPATTFTAGWADKLVQQVNASFMESLIPDSVYPRLSAAGLRLAFGRNGQINVPSRLATPTVAGAFVLEGNPIPVKQAAFTSVPITPKKMAVITTFTREISQYSTPAIEALLRDAIREDTTSVLDSTLLDATAASSTRPAGIRNGVAATTATAGGGLAALVGDVKALIAALQTGLSQQLRNPIWIMNSQQATSISLITTTAGVAVFPFQAQIEAGRFAGYPVIISNTVTAGMVILIDAADFVSAEGDDPMFDVSDQATFQMDDAPTTTGLSAVGSPNVVAAPIRSLWQTDCIGLRMIMPVNWILRRAGGVAWTQAVTW